MTVIVFVFPDGERRSIEVADGWTVLEAARSADIPVEGACGGSMACATCHVYVDEDWYGRLATATPEEEDMLDLAAELASTSRLGCQIRLKPALDGLIVTLPRSTLLDD